ncbi:hypothetical protein BY996DRAFT_6902461 [Phakopsora pachyrhizi]|nr:hypothetical protein BY996DRAFT_6902461 [Phakopsora pachyrhizi]
MHLILRGTPYEDERILEISKIHYDHIVFHCLPKLTEQLNSLCGDLSPHSLSAGILDISLLIDLSNQFVHQLTNTRDTLTALCDPNTLASADPEKRQVLEFPSFRLYCIVEDLKLCLDQFIKSLIEHYQTYFDQIHAGFNPNQKSSHVPEEVWSAVYSTNRICLGKIYHILHNASMTVPRYFKERYQQSLLLIDDAIEEVEAVLVKPVEDSSNQTEPLLAPVGYGSINDDDVDLLQYSYRARWIYLSQTSFPEERKISLKVCIPIVKLIRLLVNSITRINRRRLKIFDQFSTSQMTTILFEFKVCSKHVDSMVSELSNTNSNSKFIQDVGSRLLKSSLKVKDLFIEVFESVAKDKGQLENNERIDDCGEVYKEEKNWIKVWFDHIDLSIKNLTSTLT